MEYESEHSRQMPPIPNSCENTKVRKPSNDIDKVRQQPSFSIIISEILGLALDGQTSNDRYVSSNLHMSYLVKPFGLAMSGATTGDFATITLQANGEDGWLLLFGRHQILSADSKETPHGDRGNLSGFHAEPTGFAATGMTRASK